MARARLHLDADPSLRGLCDELRWRGHDVTRTPNEWMPEDASDEEQLLRATARGRALFSFNASHFVPLAERYPEHAGIILARQRQRRLEQGSARRMLSQHRRAGRGLWNVTALPGCLGETAVASGISPLAGRHADARRR